MWVLSQARQAMQSHKYLPAFIEAVTLPDEFARFQALDMSKWRGSDNAPEIRDLSEAVRHVVTSRTKADSKLPSRATAQGPVLFLCYRREDTQDAAGRLHDRLVDAYGAERVFIDIDSVPLGIDFVEHVAEQIGKCNVVIVMIGKKWHAIKDKKRRRRLDNEDDLVRAEIRAALQQKIPVIPVTVQNATMPHAEDLPDDIRLLARRNGIQLDAARWRTDVERLIKELDRVMKPSSSNS